MKCQHCYYEILGRRHESLCPYNPVNTRKIVLFLKNYLLSNSRFNKNFTPFPSPRELDIFCRRNKIARVKTIASRYLDKDTKLTDWLTELLDYALSNNILGPHEFPYFLQFVYDAWTFHSLEEYRRIYEESIVYEDGDPLTTEILGLHHTSSAIIKRLRTAGKSFGEERKHVLDFLETTQ